MRFGTTGTPIVEYATTSTYLTRDELLSPDSDRTYLKDVPDTDLTPVKPNDGATNEGWVLVGSSCNNTRVFWFWERK